ncbi:hypothetical protein LCGC14_2331360 [marine sediment metagenome]|uniref:Uncharacterized protein n=1 Tax=marine sediment metagenome TaxID=412755 RepID=A0A0F9D284_9ZZZZ
MNEEQKKNQFIRKEIESHSSGLTNQRIDVLMKIVIRVEMDANNMLIPTIHDAIAYHSALLTLYFETSECYDNDTELSLRINKLVSDGETVQKFLRMSPDATQYHVEWLIQNSKKWRHLMHKGLQNLKYWFRFGKHDPKGIDEILSLFEKSDKKKEVKDGAKEQDEK